MMNNHEFAAVDEQTITEEQMPHLQQKRDEQARPNGLPDKFWDAERNEVRVGALWRSYQVLEQRFSRGEVSIPESHEQYCIECGEFESDPKVNAVLHKAGFSNEQAQLVYDLARHYVLPHLHAKDKAVEGAQIKGRLEEHFGGKERWNTVARQLGDWSKAHLPEDVIDAMSNSFEGVLALYRMMAADEPNIQQRQNGDAGELDEKRLRELMSDPRYWRDQDKALVAKVRAGFERLYPN